MLKDIRNFIIFLLKYLSFWLLYFIFSRFLFIIFHLKSGNFSFFDIISAYYYGLKLDISAATYLVIIPAILFCIKSIFYKANSFIEKSIKYYTKILIILISILVIADLHLYYFWGFRINKSAISYLINPQEVFASISIFSIFIDLVGIILLSILFIIIFNKFFNYTKFVKSTLTSIIVKFLIILSLIIPIRGGIGIAPLSISVAYFHTNNTLNHAALNLLWNFIYSYTITNSDKNPYDFFNSDKCEMIIKEFHSKNIYKTTIYNSTIEEVKRPNIILIISESFTAKVINQKHNNDEITPFINKFIKEGFYFENFYANGNRTDKGLIAIINSLPAYGNFSQMTMPEKFSKIASLPKILKNHGYKNYFYYGGDINFFRMKAYLIESGYDKIISDKEIKANIKKSKWGYPDHVIFEKVFNDLNNRIDTPFFITILTLSNHDPYDIPVLFKFGNNSDTEKFLSAINYADSCSGIFIEKLKHTKYWNNSIVIFTADHGSRMPELSDYFLPENYKIPMLWIGGIIKKEKNISNYASQIDIAPTLLDFINIKHSENTFYGNNIFNKNFSFYTFYEGFTFLNNFTTTIFFDKVSSLTGSNIDTLGINYTKAILQISYSNFLSY